ncbi:hypothetical protein GCM10023350_31040 [Nocardioides endophyticus]|uniref:Uncharacterized protein n=1 Tax=Nocardioides endophyticus TaxID=1353775 RepID=A0ABP8Z1W4_9ACTN
MVVRDQVRGDEAVDVQGDHDVAAGCEHGVDASVAGRSQRKASWIGGDRKDAWLEAVAHVPREESGIVHGNHDVDVYLAG